jgi:crossover junction endodeoxyribonuclease RuvC
MIVLGLDLSSTNTGYAIMNTEFNLITYGLIRPPQKMTHSQKLKFIYDGISSILNETRVDHISIEDQYFKINGDTAKLLIRISGVAMLVAEQNNISHTLYTPNSIKLNFSGSGKAQKQDMIDKANELFKINIINDNVADAIGCAYTHIIKSSGP